MSSLSCEFPPPPLPPSICVGVSPSWAFLLGQILEAIRREMEYNGRRRAAREQLSLLPDPSRLSPVINDPEQLSPVVNDPVQLSPIVNDPSRLSPIINDPDHLSPVITDPGRFSPSVGSDPARLSPMVGDQSVPRHLFKKTSPSNQLTLYLPR